MSTEYYINLAVFDPSGSISSFIYIALTPFAKLTD